MVYHVLAGTVSFGFILEDLRVRDQHISWTKHIAMKFMLKSHGVFHTPKMNRYMGCVSDESAVGLHVVSLDSWISTIKQPTPNNAQLKSSLSLILTDTLVFCKVNPICSAIPMNRFDIMES